MKPKISETTRIEVIAWYKLKRSLGSCRTKGAEIGISESAVRDIISIHMKKERRESERQAKIAVAYGRVRQAHGLR